MRESTVAIVGSGIAAATMSYVLTQQGYDVTLFEKGPEYPYPHSLQFRERILYRYENEAYTLPRDLKAVSLSGEYQDDVNAERVMVVGGSATHWNAITLRMRPQDFKTRRLYGYGNDWPLTYDMLEPYYARAEALLGVSGTDADNPFAPPRSHPYPLPPFGLSYDDRILAEKLRQHGLILHTTPQARTRAPYDGRPACENFGTCYVCPIGARYSPTHHLLRAQATGLCAVHTNVSVRRILLDKSGRASALVYQPNAATQEQEQAAKVIILAAGAIESARLLLLSRDEGHPAGLGNQGGHVGQHLTFHHLWQGTIAYKERLYPGRVGPMTGQSQQFCDPPSRGTHGGIKIEFASHLEEGLPHIQADMTGAEIVEVLEPMLHRRDLLLHAESIPSPKKFVTLADARDRFGDPFAHIHYESADFDYDTYNFGHALFGRFVTATDGDIIEFGGPQAFSSGAHHMGTCRMGQNAQDSVVNAFGQVHGIPNLFAVGASTFVGSSGAVNPTLTLVALALRTADYLVEQVLS
jgi:choline dehydrogenase-like flavoprotein